MNKKKELKTTRALVKNILEQDAETRNSDNHLYLNVIRAVAKEKNVDLNEVSITNFLSNITQWGFPPFESVRRARQQLQHDNPNLASNEAVQDFRTQNEAVFRDFARGEL